jgi:hypothetical protein
VGRRSRSRYGEPQVCGQIVLTDVVEIGQSVLDGLDRLPDSLL